MNNHQISHNVKPLREDAEKSLIPERVKPKGIPGKGIDLKKAVKEAQSFFQQQEH